MRKSRTLLRGLGFGAAAVIFTTTLASLAAQEVRAESTLTVYTTTASEDLKLYQALR